MPFYHRLGEVPRKRHIAFHRPDGTLLQEELMGNNGFSGPSALLYHLRPPTSFRSVKKCGPQPGWQPEPEPALGHRHFLTPRLGESSSMAMGRVPLLYNRDVAVSFARASQPDPFFYRNGQGDELVYVSAGSGVLESVMGEVPFGPGDYLVIPRGIVHRYRITQAPLACLIFESAGAVRIPRHYRNQAGQMLESAPYSERDIRRPASLPVHDEKGSFPIIIKRDNRFVEAVLDHHPFDVVGWDGAYYPWAFQIRDFEPRVGLVHLPPPVHQTFEGDGFVVCSFVPRLYDFHPQAVPAPYHHSNCMTDEVLFYASDEFMSRKGIAFGSITLHPDGLPHGPQPGRIEASIGQTSTNELAVMLDTFRPLRVSAQATEIEDVAYAGSWISEEDA